MRDAARQLGVLGTYDSRSWADLVMPIDGEVRVLEKESRTLATIRDVLLPKLVTGQIDVSELDLDDVVGPLERPRGASPSRS